MFVGIQHFMQNYLWSIKPQGEITLIFNEMSTLFWSIEFP